MDKNKLIGLVLISILLIVYTHFFDNKLPKSSQQTTTTQEVSHNTSNIQLQTSEATLNFQTGIFAKATQGVAKDIVLENKDIRVTLSSHGAKVKEVILKQYKDYLDQPLKLLDKQSSDMGFQFISNQATINTSQLFFHISDTDQHVQGNTPSKATFVLPLGPNQYLQQVYTLPSEGYALTQDWEFVGTDSYIDQGKIDFVWHDFIRRAEKDVQACRNKTTINYYLANKNFKHLKEQTDQQEEQTIQTPIQWLAVKQRFFTAGIFTDQPFESGKILLKPTTQPDKFVKEAYTKLSLASNTSQTVQKGTFKFYFGPNIYKELNSFAQGFSKNLPLGWPIVKWINLYFIIPIFSFIEKYISNYGLVILILVIFVKLLLFPLSYKSYISMAEMKVLKPTLDALKAKHGNDMQSMQMEQVKLYREMGINPLSGCIPVLLQMPILLAMFNFFPNAIDLRQKAFLWAPDLSTYDAIINLPFKIPFYGDHVSLFTLLMTASTILYTWSSNQVNTPQGPMKTMSYLLPITFMFILNSFPAGLSFYYFISNLFTFAQQALIKRFVDEDKIKAKLAKNKEKAVTKEGSFKKRFQDAIKSSTSHNKGRK
jgi:YidC/Oxa1 family membrane protein insertase